MKFVRQVDPYASYIGRDGTPHWIRAHYVEDVLVAPWLALLAEGARAGYGLPMEVLEAPDGAIFDPGGAVMIGEPCIDIVVRGQRLVCFLRSADSLYPLLRKGPIYLTPSPQAAKISP